MAFFISASISKVFFDVPQYSVSILWLLCFLSFNIGGDLVSFNNSKGEVALLSPFLFIKSSEWLTLLPLLFWSLLQSVWKSNLSLNTPISVSSTLTNQSSLTWVEKKICLDLCIGSLAHLAINTSYKGIKKLAVTIYRVANGFKTQFKYQYT